MMIKGYISDYGGTIDTDGCHWAKMLWHAYERHCRSIREADFREAYVYTERALGGQPIIQSEYSFHRTLDIKLRLQLSYLQEKGVLTCTSKAAAALRQDLLSDLYARVQATCKASQSVLLRLKKDCPLVLVSNFYGNLHVVLREFGLDDVFLSVVESALVGVKKPDHRIFLLGVQRLGMQPEEVMVVGDSYEKDVLPAKKAGCKVTWLKGEQWSTGLADDAPCAADRVISSLWELLQ